MQHPTIRQPISSSKTKVYDSIFEWTVRFNQRWDTAGSGHLCTQIICENNQIGRFPESNATYYADINYRIALAASKLVIYYRNSQWELFVSLSSQVYSQVYNNIFFNDKPPKLYSNCLPATPLSNRACQAALSRRCHKTGNAYIAIIKWASPQYYLSRFHIHILCEA